MNSKILILAANPKSTNKLRLHEELREIKNGLRRAKARDQFLIESAEAVRYRDIHRSIMDFEPQIIHFSGHGAGEQGLVFEDEIGQEKLVDAEALAGLFELFAEHVNCVLLNACYSEIQAKAIAQHIDYVIGMSQQIGDKAAIEFAVGFYDALGAGKSIEFAYKLGCRLIRIAGIPESLTPKLLTKNQSSTEGENPTAPFSAVSVELPIPESSRSTSNVKLKTQISEDISSECGVDYRQLRDLLKAQKWKEGDQETLAVMLKAAGREEEGWLSSESIENFPCTDLRTIDQLWVKYSEGRFGFSVQKRIWERVGKDYEKFGDRVGWRRIRESSGYWLSLDQLTFSNNALQGHLPVVHQLWKTKRIGWVEFLASTLQKCNI
jgi:hypothetical protein